MSLDHIDYNMKVFSSEFHSIEKSLPGFSECPLIAGPCAFESEAQFERICKFLSAKGIRYIRGGAFKLRTNPDSFVGLGDIALRSMAKIAETYSVKIVSEIIDIRDISLFDRFVDVIQVGARNMSNYPLIQEATKIGKPVIIKRGTSATLKEWLGAVEYALYSGSKSIILCERGIRSYDPSFRNVLDLSIVAWIKENTTLPIIVDPSHGIGLPQIIPNMSNASFAAGADGLMIEVHGEPEKALCDSKQALSFEMFDQVMNIVNKQKQSCFS